MKSEKKRSKFDHQFSGYSVWIEPCPEEVGHLLDAMNTIQDFCGGVSSGAHHFSPHCTLLYNFSPDDLDDSQQLIPLEKEDKEGRCQLKRRRKEIGEKLLQECLLAYKEAEKWTTPTVADGVNINIDLIPTKFMFFPFPKDADNGKGFGCVISLLLLEKTPNLERLHSIVRKTFPSDERHGRSTSSTADNEVSNHDHDPDQGKFIPHMSLCYAPECCHEKLEKYTDNVNSVNREQGNYESVINREMVMQLMKGRYLSLWSTEGQLKDWEFVARIPLL